MNRDDIIFTWQNDGNNRVVIISAQFPGGDRFTDKLDIADSEARSKFVRAVCEKRNGVDKEAVAQELERIAGEAVGRRGRMSQADKLVGLASTAELFHTPGGHDSEGYATVDVRGHKETWPINSKGFRRWLSRLYWEQLAKAPGAQAVQDAINVLAGKAVHVGSEHPVAVRIAEHGGDIYLDLADADWRVIEIKNTGWKMSPNLRSSSFDVAACWPCRRQFVVAGSPSYVLWLTSPAIRPGFSTSHG